MSKQRAINYSKVQWAEYYYVNQFGEQARTKLRTPSVHGAPLENPNAYAMAHPSYPFETIIERARRLEILDVWTPCCSLIINANKSLHFKGDKATKVWKSYCKHIYGK